MNLTRNQRGVKGPQQWPSCGDCGGEPKEGRTRCAECAAKKNAYMRLCRRRMAEKGLCRTCGAEKVPNRSVCQRCLDNMKSYIKGERARRKTAGRCTDCGQRSELGQVRCVICGSKRRKSVLPRPVVNVLNTLRAQRIQEERDRAAKIKRDFIDRNIHLIYDERAKTILLARYGYTAAQGQTLEQIGRRFRLTRERIRQIQSRAELDICVRTKEVDLPILKQRAA